MGSKQFTLRARVYYEDTDAAGIVYHANYLKFMERARTEWLRAIGYDQFVLAREHQVGFVVRKMDIDFVRPARLDDEINIISRLSKCGRASMVFQQSICREQEVLCGAEVKVGCIDLRSGRPQPMSEQLYREIKNAG
ncbi:MAG: tol-pal system-associated acyl-CoA thioesterase [Gammaproteobacteria bacterium]